MKNSFKNKEIFFKRLIKLEVEGKTMEFQNSINDNLKYFTPMEISELLEFSKENENVETVTKKELEAFRKEKKQALAREYFIDPSQKNDLKTVEEVISNSQKEPIEIEAIETIVLKI